MYNFILNIVKEKGIVNIILNYKYSIEHYEKYNNVLRDLYLSYNIYNELNLTRISEVCYGNNNNYYLKTIIYKKDNNNKNKIKIETSLIYSKDSYFVDLTSFRVL